MDDVNEEKDFFMTMILGIGMVYERLLGRLFVQAGRQAGRGTSSGYRAQYKNTSRGKTNTGNELWRITIFFLFCCLIELLQV